MFVFLFENFRLGLKNLYLHKLRTLLTAAGIIIGVAAVIVMVAIGEGQKREAERQMERLGVNNILVRSIKPQEGAQASRSRLAEYGLTDTDVTRLRAVPGLERLVPARQSKSMVSRSATQYPAVNAIATTPDLFAVTNMRAQTGSVLMPIHEEQQQTVCVIGADAARLIFPSEDPMGQTIQIGDQRQGRLILTVIGILEPTGLRAGADKQSFTTRDIDTDIYFPLSLSRQVLGKTNIRMAAGVFERESIEYTEMWAQVKRVEDVEQTASIFGNILGLPQRNDIQVKAPIELLRAAEKQARMFNYIMGSIAGFSLVVGGIGIMNIMLATVTERTREIGIRRALGAKQRHITLQFLIETTVISLSGGLLGVLLGIGLAKGMGSFIAFLKWLFSLSIDSNAFPTAIATWSVVGSFVASGVIGIFFGLYPAITAARMNPIEALRHE